MCRKGRVSRIVTTESPQSLTMTPAAPWLAPPVAMAPLLVAESTFRNSTAKCCWCYHLSLLIIFTHV